MPSYELKEGIDQAQAPMEKLAVEFHRAQKLVNLLSKGGCLHLSDVLKAVRVWENPSGTEGVLQDKGFQLG